MRTSYSVSSTIEVPSGPLESRDPYSRFRYRFQPEFWTVAFGWFKRISDGNQPIYRLVGPKLTKDGLPFANGAEVELPVPVDEVPMAVRRDLARSMEDKLDAYVRDREDEIAAVLDGLD
jgi:hypothetical protein